MPQVGIYSAYQLGLHNHLDNNNGGILADYSRYGAFRAPSRAGAMALHVDNDTVRTTVSNAYTLLKQFTVDYDYNYGGTIQFRWEMSTSTAGQEVGSAAFVNGIQVGVDEVIDLVAYQPFDHDYDVGLNSGDLIQIYGKRNGMAGTQCRIRNFRLYYDWRIYHFGDGTTHVLNTSLVLADTDALDISATTGY